MCSLFVIISVLNIGSTVDKVKMYMYSPEVEDFSGKNNSASRLSEWVFEETEKFFENSKVDSAVTETLHKNGLVLFLHLLGTDVSGHVNKPHSRLVLNEIFCNLLIYCSLKQSNSLVCINFF